MSDGRGYEDQPVPLDIRATPHSEGETIMVGWNGAMPEKFYGHIKTERPQSGEQVELTGGGDGDTYFIVDHGTKKGYEFYKNVNHFIDRHGKDGAAKAFVDLMPWGTPDQVLRKLEFIREKIHMNGIMCAFSYAGMPRDDVERSLRCFTDHVLPELQKWDVEPFEEPAPLALPAA